MIDNPEEQLQRVVNRLRKVVEDYSAQVIEEINYMTKRKNKLFSLIATI